MFPIATNSRVSNTPWATDAIVASNVLIHLIVTWYNAFMIPSEIGHTWGFVPASFADLSRSSTLITCLFLHGDLFHLSGNMLFLLVFGRLLESSLGTINFLSLYMATGVTGCLAHAIVASESTKPLIGASGAITGVLGAFLIANPRARITLVLDPTLIYFLRWLTVRLPARVFLLGWLLLQLGLALRPRVSNVAFWAHVGGFAGGAMSTIAIYPYFSKQVPRYVQW